MRVDIIGSTISNGGLIYEQKKIDISRTYSCNVNRITCRMWRFFTEFITEPVVLQWWGSFPENMGPNQVCEAFNKIDPNLQVEYTRFVNDDAGNTKLDVSLPP